MLLNASRHSNQGDFDAMHLDFDTALDYVVERAGDINVYDIRIDGEYEGIYGFIQNFYNPTFGMRPLLLAFTD